MIEFYKEHEDDKIWWVDYVDFFGDYPQNFTNEEKALFDKENPYWANFFSVKRNDFYAYHGGTSLF